MTGKSKIKTQTNMALKNYQEFQQKYSFFITIQTNKNIYSNQNVQSFDYDSFDSHLLTISRKCVYTRIVISTFLTVISNCSIKKLFMELCSLIFYTSKFWHNNIWLLQLQLLITLNTHVSNFMSNKPIICIVFW